MRFDDLIKSLEDFKEILQKKHTETRNKYHGDNTPAYSKSAQEKASDEEQKNLKKLKQKVMKKSNYGPKGSGQYDPTANIRRKMRNIEEDVVQGPNNNSKQYTSAARGTAQQQAIREAAEMRRRSKTNPVKIYTKEEIAAENARRAKKNDELNPPFPLGKEETAFNKSGQWSIKKIGGYGTAMTVGGGTSILGAANKTDQIPGGKADKKKPSDFDPKALKEGIEHELEHTSDKDIAEEIAMDHLTEDPQYYKKLKTIED